MKIVRSDNFVKLYQQLPHSIKNKIDKQLLLLVHDIFYPSLRTKKMGGSSIWEARVDRSYRMTFEKTKDTLILKTIGPHDEGLGKK